MKRPSRHFRIADRVAHLLESILPAFVCAHAVASCRFTIQGPRSVGLAGKNWGEWVRTRLKTGGINPSRGLAPTGDVWQGDGVKSGDAHRNADMILEPFGLSIQDVLAHYGEPIVGERYDVDLVDVIEALSPQLLATETTEAVAVA